MISKPAEDDRCCRGRVEAIAPWRPRPGRMCSDADACRAAGFPFLIRMGRINSAPKDI